MLKKRVLNIHPDETFFHHKCLNIIGSTINTNSIPEENLKDIHSYLSKTTAADLGTYPVEYSGAASLKMRSVITTNLKTIYKYHVPNELK